MPTLPLHITVAVCTWNRCQMLGRTLQQMTRLAAPGDVTWELVVVNNGCTDETDEVIASFHDRLPVRRAREPVPGLANARNRAVAEATGDYLIWTDDDILVDEGWLAAYCRAFRRWPEAAVFGGPIEPLFEGVPPAWIVQVLDQIGPVYGRQTLGDRPVPLAPETLSAGPFGGNMAMRRDVHRKFPFNPDLGVRHNEYAIGEETEVMRRVLTSGHRGWWTPEPRAWHRVPAGNQNLAYVRRWMVGCGRYIAQFPERDRSLHGNGLVRLCARMLRHEIRFRLGRFYAPDEVWMKDLTRASQARGRILASMAGKPGRG